VCGLETAKVAAAPIINVVIAGTTNTKTDNFLIVVFNVNAKAQQRYSIYEIGLS
jgi:hypothetical protein